MSGVRILLSGHGGPLLKPRGRIEDATPGFPGKGFLSLQGTVPEKLLLGLDVPRRIVSKAAVPLEPLDGLL